MPRKSLCLTTYVFGNKYQGYIPILLYSLLRAYPDYHPVIFVREKIDAELKKTINAIEKELGRVTVIDGMYQSCSFKHIQKGKSVRWILDKNVLMNFDFCYFVDIDMFYIQENPSLLSQHIEHAALLGLPYSNIVRRNSFTPYSPQNVKLRLQSFGLIEALNFSIKKSLLAYKLSGLHFIICKEYYYHLQPVIDKYKSFIFGGTSFPHHPAGFNNECLLYDMIQESELRLPPYLDSIGPHWLDYRRFREVGFRPHHGIHLGMFRSQELEQACQVSLCQDFYKEYYATYKYLRENDDFLGHIISKSPLFIKHHFMLLESFYSRTDN